MKSEHIQLEDSIYRLFEVTPVPIILSYPDGKFEYVNPALSELLGYEGDAIYADDVIITHPDDIEANKEIRTHLKSSPFTPIKIEKRYKHRLGHTIYAQLHIVAQADAQGVIKRYISQLVDLNSIQKSDAAEILLNQLVNQSNDAIYVVDAQFGRVLNCNNLAYRRLGYSKDELLKLRVADINSDYVSDEKWHQQLERIKDEGSFIIESAHRRKNGSIFPIEANVSCIKYNDTDYLLAIVRDISKRKEREKAVYEQLNLDPLTGVPNRRVLDKKLKELFATNEQSKHYIAFMYIDLDNFKQINDHYGHTIGDGVLKQTANRLKNCVRQSDIISRLGGDEFLVVMPNLEAEHLIEVMAKKLEQEFSSPYKIQGQLLRVDASIGVAVYLNSDDDAEALIKQADEAMYQAKKKAGTSIYYIK